MHIKFIKYYDNSRKLLDFALIQYLSLDHGCLFHTLLLLLLVIVLRKMNMLIEHLYVRPYWK